MSDMKRYFKVLDENGRSYRGGDATWSLPTRDADGTWIPGEWMPCVAGELYPCVNGYHVVTPDQLVRWLGPRIFEVEIGPEIEQDRDKSVVRTCRLLREYTNWNERIAWYFACDCADEAVKKAGGNYLASAEAHWQARRLFELLGG